MNFTTASSVEQALAALAAGARPVAGGSDLVVGARQGKAPLPDSLVAIDRVAGLGAIAAQGGGLTLGALVTHRAIVGNDTIRARYSALADGSALVGSAATRNVGTLGGNIMNASPAMDTGAALVVLDAVVELSSVRGSRDVEIADLWTGPGRTVAAHDELLTGVRLPALNPRSGSAYVRLEYRRCMEIAVVGAAALVTLDAAGAVASCRIALTAVAPTIVRSPAAEAAISGKAIGEETLAAVAAGAAADARPISDLRGSERYRRHMVGVMARRAVEAAAARAAGKGVPVPANHAIGIGVPLEGVA
jgi:CO/xanthine dehydrogenase FAD-binding subunit